MDDGGASSEEERRESTTTTPVKPLAPLPPQVTCQPELQPQRAEKRIQFEPDSDSCEGSIRTKKHRLPLQTTTTTTTTKATPKQHHPWTDEQCEQCPSPTPWGGGCVQRS